MSIEKRTPHSADDRRLRSERGGAMPFVLVVGASLAFVAAYSLMGGVATRRAAGRDFQHKAAFICAERGLQVAKSVFIFNKEEWSVALDPTNTAYSSLTWYPLSEYCQYSAGYYRYTATMRDNLDDTNQAADSDGAVIIDVVVSRSYPYTPVASLSALVSGRIVKMMSGHRQEGGAANTFNK